MNNLVPEIPVLAEYNEVKQELIKRIDKINAIEYINADNEKEVKKAIAEINKVKDRIARFRIDNTNAFMEHIKHYTDQCKELEKMCVDGVSSIKAKISELEEQERQNKIDLIKKCFEMTMMNYAIVRNHLTFEHFYQKQMSNKSVSLNVVESQLKEWAEAKENELIFIQDNCDEPATVINIYKNNGLNVTKAISEYQERFKSEAEIKAIIASEESKKAKESFEQVLDICIKINKLPKSKVQALQSFLDSLKVEFTVERI